MSRHGAPSGLAWQVGDVYTLHLWPPFGMPGVQQSGHYTGWALEGRLPVPAHRSRPRPRRPADPAAARGGRVLGAGQRRARRDQGPGAPAEVPRRVPQVRACAALSVTSRRAGSPRSRRWSGPGGTAPPTTSAGCCWRSSGWRRPRRTWPSAPPPARAGADRPRACARRGHPGAARRDGRPCRPAVRAVAGGGIPGRPKRPRDGA